MQIQKEYLTRFLNEHPHTVIVGSLGTISYDLKEIEHPKRILVEGAMGCAVAVGLGYALSSEEEVEVFIGDGSMLMKLGSLATVQKYAPKNLHITVLDNGIYKSTGGQPTNFEQVINDEEAFSDVVKVHP